MCCSQPARTDLGSVHRRIGDLDAYLLVNTGPQIRTQRVTLRAEHSGIEVWDAADGTVVAVGRTTGWS